MEGSSRRGAPKRPRRRRRHQVRMGVALMKSMMSVHMDEMPGRRRSSDQANVLQL